MQHSIFLGIDPGTNITGFGFLKTLKAGSMNPRSMQVIDAGVIRPSPSLSHSERVGQIHESLYDIIAEGKPDYCIIEKGFTGINHHSALRLGETRGSIIAAVTRWGLPLIELPATQVKKTVTGKGHAGKDDVALAVKALLGFDRGSLPFDVTDAVAIALCFAISHLSTTSMNLRNLNPS